MSAKGSAWAGVSVLVLGAVLAATPVRLSLDPDAGLGLGPAMALADDDGDSSGSGSGGGGGHDRDDDNSGGGGGGGDRDDDDSGGDDRDDDDSGSGGGGHGGGGDDGGRDDDRSGHGGGDDDHSDDRDDDRADDDRGGRGGRTTVGPAGDGSGRLRVVKVEQGPDGTEVTYSNGVEEEVENGRYEQKDAAGRTLVERPATAADLRRIGVNIRNSGLVVQRPRGEVRTIEVGGGAIEVRYTTGWKEELEGGRYELKDPNDNTVVERPATAADRQRMQALAGR